MPDNLLDEARLRELAEAALDAYPEALSGTRPKAVNDFVFACNPPAILAPLDALSAERERADRAVGLLREALDWTQCNAACDAHFGMRCNCGGSDFDDRVSAFLATQKAEGA